MCTASRFNPPRLLLMIFSSLSWLIVTLETTYWRWQKFSQWDLWLVPAEKQSPTCQSGTTSYYWESKKYISLLVNHHVLGLIHYCSLAWHNIDKWINSKRIIFKSIISDPFHFVWFVENELHLVLYFINSVY